MTACTLLFLEQIYITNVHHSHNTYQLGPTWCYIFLPPRNFFHISLKCFIVSMTKTFRLHTFSKQCQSLGHFQHHRQFTILMIWLHLTPRESQPKNENCHLLPFMSFQTCMTKFFAEHERWYFEECWQQTDFHRFPLISIVLIKDYNGSQWELKLLYSFGRTILLISDEVITCWQIFHLLCELLTVCLWELCWVWWGEGKDPLQRREFLRLCRPRRFLQTQSAKTFCYIITRFL